MRLAGLAGHSATGISYTRTPSFATRAASTYLSGIGLNRVELGLDHPPASCSRSSGVPLRAPRVALGVPASRIYRFLRERGVLRSRSEARALSRALQWAGVERKRAEAAPAGKARKAEWPAELAAELAAEVLARYAAGEPGPAIAEELGLTRWRVYALLRERGVVRTKSEARMLREARRRPARTEE